MITEVEPDDANVQLPTEATHEWVATPGGGFTPGGTGAGGKVHKAALPTGCVARAQPYARRPLRDACNGFGAVVGVLGVRLEKALAATEAPTYRRP